MRKIGSLLRQSQANTIGSYLYVQGIENTVQFEEDGAWGLWIHDDHDMERSKEILKRFMENPDHPDFQKALFEAKSRRAHQKKEELRFHKKKIDLRTKWQTQHTKTGRLSLGLIIISVIIAIISKLGHDNAILQPFFINSFEISGRYIQFPTGLYDVMHGQVWRLITPIFIHFGIIHLLFNMLWLRDLGSMIENHQNSIILGFQVLVIGILSNVAQFFVSGPSFGGMSGVVYGLLGYVWIRGKFDPRSGLFLHKHIVVMMIAWFFLCLTGLIGNVANTAHGVGLVVGMAWGYLSSGHLRRLFQ